ncbi:hypothetical protein RRG08_050721 [Elysia crispata]|uniref:Uncharacterized protein n=1 Tax=Elysia crispata TaxID=231223 RepID=A0AAE1DMZ7_9GAST|nr:hypothetical protein RRG08_050721 [Elysia crispata]
MSSSRTISDIWKEIGTPVDKAVTLKPHAPPQMRVGSESYQEHDCGRYYIATRKHNWQSMFYISNSIATQVIVNFTELFPITNSAT